MYTSNAMRYYLLYHYSPYKGLKKTYFDFKFCLLLLHVVTLSLKVPKRESPSWETCFFESSLRLNMPVVQALTDTKKIIILNFCTLKLDYVTHQGYQKAYKIVIIFTSTFLHGIDYQTDSVVSQCVCTTQCLFDSQQKRLQLTAKSVDLLQITNPLNFLVDAPIKKHFYCFLSLHLQLLI